MTNFLIDLCIWQLVLISFCMILGCIFPEQFLSLMLTIDPLWVLQYFMFFIGVAILGVISNHFD